MSVHPDPAIQPGLPHGYAESMPRFWPVNETRRDQPESRPDAQVPSDAGTHNLHGLLKVRYVQAHLKPLQAAVNHARTAGLAMLWLLWTQAHARRSTVLVQDRKTSYQRPCWLLQRVSQNVRWRGPLLGPFQSGHCGLQTGLRRETVCR